MNYQRNLPLKIEYDIENAIEFFNNIIQTAAWNSTSPATTKNQQFYLEKKVEEQIKDKRRLRKLWQQTRDRNLKKLLNKAVKKLRAMLLEVENNNISKYLESLSPTEATDYSLRKTTKKMRSQTNHSLQK